MRALSDVVSAIPAVRVLPALLALTCAPAALSAQRVSAEFSPNPAPPGAAITMTCTDATGQGLNLPSPCTWYRIHQGTQGGPVVPLAVGCPTVIVPVAPNATFQLQWDQRDGNGQLVSPGRYWIEVRTWDSAFSLLVVDWFCISIQAANEPALTAAGPVRLGQVTPLAIAAPQQPGALHLAAAALSMNQPLSAFGIDTCLGLPLFLDPLAVPIGVLDGAGNSSGLAIGIPNVPVALRQAIHVQALLTGPAGMQTTNALSFTIQP